MGKQPLNILVMTIGTRGDIQPYLQIGKTLKTKHGHRVRIATHPRFQNLVEQDGLMEFHSIGGDPADLMSYRLKSLKSKMEALQEVLTMMSQMFVGFWSACVDLPSVPPRLLSPSKYGIPTYPFVADAIIANPACYAHIHCAERLGIPLHIMFMSSRSPTRELPHPQSIWKCNSGFANFASYQITEYLFSQALGRLLNNFRYDYLGLNPIAAVWVPGQFYRMHIPHSYLWSQAIAPKPREWGEEIDVVGHVLDPADSYAPPKSLLDFLSSGKPPVYIGFGSVASSAIDRTNIILEAVDKAGIRAIIGRGWSNLVVPDCIGAHVYVAEDVPHNWLFPRVHSVVHHGGAGTTAISLRYGRPAVIIPFTGDQFFWGSQVVKLGIGTTIPYSDLTADRLAGAIQHVNSPDIFATATALATKMQREWNGADNAAESFLRKFDQQTWNGMCCILQDRLAVWRERRTGVKLSALAAHILFANEEVEGQDLQPYRQVDWTQYRNLAGLRPGWLAKVTGQLTTTRHSQKPGYGSHKDPDLARSPVGGISVGKRFLAFQRYLLYIVKVPIYFVLFMIIFFYNLFELVNHAVGDNRSVKTAFEKPSSPFDYLYNTILTDDVYSLVADLSGSLLRGLLLVAISCLGALAMAIEVCLWQLQEGRGESSQTDIVMEARTRQGAAEFGAMPVDTKTVRSGRNEVTARVCSAWLGIIGQTAL